MEREKQAVADECEVRGVDFGENVHADYECALVVISRLLSDVDGLSGELAACKGSLAAEVGLREVAEGKGAYAKRVDAYMAAGGKTKDDVKTLLVIADSIVSEKYPIG